jgi:ketosteroid isomerase-like protein
VFAFDIVPPREYPTYDAYRQDWQTFFTNLPGPATSTIDELSITVSGDVAYTHGIEDVTNTAADGTKAHMVVRFTDVLRKTDGKWLIVLENVSFPVDLATGKADLLSTP